ncbi:glycosyltransferase [Sphingomonas sp. PP-CE-1G-424]|uniref:glycosyltransferase n=1 Tax=Sphingomonas sp. PP-CE-1G-424 TaxID=2135658 RepID=UPI001054DE87|nr:glycosyltransferase [Sphingomonas sp. PP-CE-1G-424]TCP73284.1 glycosyltransferase involved in cell wall biosynthesis [Sphingomonas sp. PP-CE-1G-424]
MSPVAQHILTYAEDLRGGGVERAQLRLARSWLAAGRRVTLAIEDIAGPLATELPEGLEIVSPFRLLTLPAVVRRLSPDVIFCPGNFYTWSAAWTRLRLGKACPPILAKMSNAPTRADHGRLMHAAHQLWLARHGGFLDHLVAMTPATADEAALATRMIGRTSVIPNPPAVAIPGALPDLPPRFILGVGRLEPQKRWDRLIATLPLLADQTIPLVLLGDGSERGAIEAQIRSLGLQDRVLLLGHSSDPLPVMARAAVLALTSEYEGVPGVLREALSVGTPVISTDSSAAVAEIVNRPDRGTVIARDDAAALIATLDAWLAPATQRPAPVPQPGADSAERYLALFDQLVRL